MAEFTITAVGGNREWTGDHGTFVIYDVSFEGATGKGDGQIKQKQTTAPPTPGLVLDAELVQKGSFPPELKRIPKNGGGFGGGGGGKSPDERAQIARMNAHAHAMKYWELKHAADPSFGFASWGDYIKVVDLFHGDVMGTKA